MEQLLSVRDYFLGEFLTVLEAPVVFFTAWAVIAYLTFVILRWSFRRQFEAMQSTVDALTKRLDIIEGERNDYRDKLAAVTVAVGEGSQEDTIAAVDAMTMRLAVIETLVGEKPSEERGENANGKYERFRDGTQVCRGRIPGDRRGATVNVTFPAMFAGVPQVSVYPTQVAAIQQVTDRGFSVLIEQMPEGLGTYVSVGSWRTPRV